MGENASENQPDNAAQPTPEMLIIDGFQWRLHPDEKRDDLVADIEQSMGSDDGKVRKVRLANDQTLLLNCRRLRYAYVGTVEIFERGSGSGFESAPSVRIGDVVKPLG
jgi:hypothetical protein